MASKQFRQAVILTDKDLFDQFSFLNPARNLENGTYPGANQPEINEDDVMVL